MNDIIVRDNAVPEQLIRNCQNQLNRFSWFISQDILPQQRHTLGINYDSNTFSSMMMVHRIYNYMHKEPRVNPGFEPVKFLLQKAVESCGFELDEVHRLKFNLTQPHPANSTNFYNVPHIDDVQVKHYSLILYPEDTDGDTVLFNEMLEVDGEEKPKLTIAERVAPKANRCVMFNGWRYHAGCNPYKYNRRIVLNCNFTIKE